MRTAAVVVLLTAMGLRLSGQPLTSYASWIEPYQKDPLVKRPPGPTLVLIFAVEGDTQLRNDHLVEASPIRAGCVVSADGLVYSFALTGMGMHGAGPVRLEAANLDRLKRLVADLPDDFSHLPPPDRRLVVQIPRGDGILVRVYDRANPPESVLELLRIAKPQIQTWVMDFRAVDEWKAGVAALSVWPDGRQIVTAANGGIGIWNPETHALVTTARPQVPIDGGSAEARTGTVVFSPDGSIAATSDWGEIDLIDTRTWQGVRRLAEPTVDGKRHQLSHAQFTRDGRYVLVESDQPAVLSFDVSTGRRTSEPLGIPPGATSFYPAPHGGRAVYITASGEIALWDPGAGRNIATLDSGGRIVCLAYSPDESKIAAITVLGRSERFRGSYRLRVWDAQGGALLHELRAFEQGIAGASSVVWLPGGKYVAATVTPDVSARQPEFYVWNSENGRHRARLEGCNRGDTTLGLLADGRLVEGCGDGVIRMWDTSKVAAGIDAFEASLEPSRR